MVSCCYLYKSAEALHQLLSTVTHQHMANVDVKSLHLVCIKPVRKDQYGHEKERREEKKSKSVWVVWNAVDIHVFFLL